MENIISPGKGLYQVFYKTKSAPNGVRKDVMWVRAVSESDAIRIASENLDTRVYEVTGAVYNPDEWRIAAEDVVIGFRHPHAV